MAVPLWYKRVIMEGDTGPDVRVVRRKLGLNPDGPFDRIVIERVKGMSNDRAEFVDEVIAELIGESAATEAGLPPEWFSGPLERGNVGPDVEGLRAALGLPVDNRFEQDCEAAVRRLQSAEGLETTGKVDEGLAILIGD